MKILYVTTIGATMSFFQEFIRTLLDEGHTVDIATNDSNRKVPDCYGQWGCRIFTLPWSRSPVHKGNVKAIGQLRKLVEEEQYDIVHCHTPIAAACTRLACKKLRKKLGVKVFYTAHGFHFYKGAPKLNWLVYYPIEKYCSRFTDKLITINQEDYALAKNKFKAKETYYVPGVGIDLSRFENVQVDKKVKKQEIGVPDDAFLLLSVGELNENKNHQIIIKALAKTKNPNIHYAIAGVGDQKDHLLELAEKLGISGQVHLLGYRKDVPELNHSADVFCFPSYREGLSASLMEASASGLACVASRIRGNTDIITNDATGILCDSSNPDDFANAIRTLAEDEEKCRAMGNEASLFADRFDIKHIIDETYKVYDIKR